MVTSTARTRGADRQEKSEHEKAAFEGMQKGRWKTLGSEEGRVRREQTLETKSAARPAACGQNDIPTLRVAPDAVQMCQFQINGLPAFSH